MKGGDIAGGIMSDEYWRINIGGRTYKAHRLAFLICKGYMPKMIDHKDTIRYHNWIDNLRSCTQSQNNINRKLPITNKSGLRGVRFDQVRNKWKVAIQVDNKKIHLGYYICKQTAAKAYDLAALKYHGEFARLNVL